MPNFPNYWGGGVWYAHNSVEMDEVQKKEMVDDLRVGIHLGILVSYSVVLRLPIIHIFRLFLFTIYKQVKKEKLFVFFCKCVIVEISGI